jgi:hypothetical protein
VTRNLTLRQLEDVLLAINNLQGAVLGQAANVAGVEPAIRLQHLRPFTRR